MLKRRIVIIGAGKISYSLADALTKSGETISSVISHNPASAEKLARSYGIKHYSNYLNDIPGSVNFYILSVPDGIIKSAAAELSRTKNSFKDNIIIHLSGAHTSSLLNPLKKKKGMTASLHIMQSFPGRNPVKIAGCYAAVETAGRDTNKILFDLSKKLNLKPFALDEKGKVFYHIAGVFASNFLSGNMFSAESLLKKSGAESGHGFDMLEPIISATLAGIKKTGAADSLSGPFERGDAGTIRAHIASLKRIKDTPLLLSYISQSLSLLGAVKIKHGKLSGDHAEIEQLLKAELKKIRN